MPQAEIRLTLGALSRAIGTDNLSAASAEAEAFARYLGAKATATNAQKAQTIVNHFAKLLRQGAREQKYRDAMAAAETTFATQNPPGSDWSTA